MTVSQLETARAETRSEKPRRSLYRAETRSEKPRRSLYRAAVLDALKRMSNGRLTLSLPDGSVRVFGDGLNPRHARFGLNARIDVKDDGFFRRCFYYADIGLAESYMAGEWTTDDLAEVVSWFILNAAEPSVRAKTVRRLLNWMGWINRASHRLRSNTVEGSRENIAAHYDLSNELFSLFLDPTMTYSSALFTREDATLEEAQLAKYERLCRLLQLKRGDRVLEIGSGWGAMSRYIAKRYGCHVTTITISREQFAWADRLRRSEGLEHLVDLRLADYRKVEGSFDKIVSIEMLEAVGHEHFDAFFGKCSELLAPDGLAALQVITFPDSRYEAMRRDVDFIQKHVFPGGLLPSVSAMLASIGRTGDLMLADLLELGPSYAKTLQCWADAFEGRLDDVRALGFDETFIRKWRYYFMYCKAAFQMRHVGVVQMLLTRPNNHRLEAVTA